MRWYENLYFGEGAKKDGVRIVKRLQAGKLQPDVYVITLAANEQNLLDIYPSYVLLQPYYQKQDLLVIGLAAGRKEAQELVAKIVDEVYQKTSEVAVRQYFQKQE